MPNLRFMKDVKIRQRFSFSFCELSYSLLELTAEKIAINIWQIIRVGIRAIKFETARIHFLGDIFAVAAVVSANI